MRKCDAESCALRRIAEYVRGRGEQGSHCGLGAVQEIEQRLRAWYGQPYVVCVSSATSGLDALAYALDLPKRAEMITSELTWGGAVAPWLRCGITPRFGNIERSTLTLSPTAARRLVRGR